MHLAESEVCNAVQNRLVTRTKSQADTRAHTIPRLLSLSRGARYTLAARWDGK